MEPLIFYKYEGCGNDFVLFEPPVIPESLDHEQLVRLCDRRFGIGSDGLLFFEMQDKGTPRMRMINPDGSEAQMCGNGIRALARHLREFGFMQEDRFEIDTLAGVKTCTCWEEEGRFMVDVRMGAPCFDPKSCTTSFESMLVEGTIETERRAFAATLVSMGNPHLVVHEYLDADQASIWGPRLEHHPWFPERINVHFCELSALGTQVTTWERGAGLTLACGTGACAVAAANVKTGRVDETRKQGIHMPGGTLMVRFEPGMLETIMSGPVNRVFQGSVLP